jgi:peptidoglycan/xylan/chitin deacetylase (PgdA/CDA1 family)
MGFVKLKKAKSTIILILIVTMVTACLLTTLRVTSASSPGTISITFDDGMQDNYDYAYPLMQARGIVGTFYVITDSLSDFSHNNTYLSIAELKTMQNSGNEIGSHSVTHEHFETMTDAEIAYQCGVSQQVLRANGFSANNFAFPYGDTNDPNAKHIDSIVSQYYRSARSAYNYPLILSFPITMFRLPGFPAETGDSSVLSRAKSAVDQVCTANGWAIFCFHCVRPTVSSPYMISTEDFASFLDYIVSKGVTTVTVNQGLNLGKIPTPVPTPTATPTPKPSATPTLSPTPKPSPSPTPTSTPTSTPTVIPTPSPEPTLSPTPSSSPTETPTPTPTPTETPMPTITPFPTTVPTPIPTPTPTAEPLPSPTPLETTVKAKTDNGTTIDLVISGNITSSQISNVTIATSQSSATTIVSFTVTGESGTTGFGTVTIPKSFVPYGATLTINNLDQPTQDNGFLQDRNNYYVWYITHFSKHQISIVFNTVSYSPNPSVSPIQTQSSSLHEKIFGIAVAVAILVNISVMLLLRKVKKKPTID